ncbi:MAG: acyl-homoserine-lactone synthase [Pseudomonadota bacterium]
MIYSLEQLHYRQNSGLLYQMYRLRKKVFFDQLNWDIDVQGNLERDSYDELDPVYLMLADPKRGQVFASMRLMPTTGPTLLHDVFEDTMPDAAKLSAPAIWECTRFCVDEELDQRRTYLPHLPASSLLLLGLCEFGLKTGIQTIAANFDPAMRRIYHKAGCEVEVLGRSDVHGARPVCCGVFEVSNRIHRQMRDKLGLRSPVYAGAPSDKDLGREAA